MTIHRKRKIIIGFLIAFAAWPLAHHGLVRALDLSPWKLFGWSMYCVPPRMIDVYVYGIEDDRRARTITTRGLGQRAAFDVQYAYDRFGERRVHLNTLVTPDDFARTIFRHFPRETEIEMEIHRYFVDPQTDRVEKIVEERVYRYTREQFERGS